MQTAHAFVFPSIKDSAGNAIVEAMASGLAPIALDYGSFRQILTDDCSLKIPLGDRAAHVAGYRATMERLAANPALCRTLGERARRRALDLFSWDARARKILQAYEWALGRRADKPDFYRLEG
jgi:glycosyltransferase involved in cell wall biosynthesis